MKLPDVTDLLTSLRRRGAELSTDGDQIVIDAPRGVLTDADLAALRRLKPLLLPMLASRVAPHRCNPTDRRVRDRRPDAPTDQRGDWLQTRCDTCGRFFGYRPSVN